MLKKSGTPTLTNGELLNPFNCISLYYCLTPADITNRSQHLAVLLPGMRLALFVMALELIVFFCFFFFYLFVLHIWRVIQRITLFWGWGVLCPFCRNGRRKEPVRKQELPKDSCDCGPWWQSCSGQVFNTTTATLRKGESVYKKKPGMRCSLRMELQLRDGPVSSSSQREHSSGIGGVVFGDEIYCLVVTRCTSLFFFKDFIHPSTVLSRLF